MKGEWRSMIEKITLIKRNSALIIFTANSFIFLRDQCILFRRMTNVKEIPFKLPSHEKVEENVKIVGLTQKTKVSFFLLMVGTISIDWENNILWKCK